MIHPTLKAQNESFVLKKASNRLYDCDFLCQQKLEAQVGTII